MRISDWSSDVCSSDLPLLLAAAGWHSSFPKVQAQGRPMDFETERRGVALDDILITGELDARGARTPDLLAENRALHDLVRQVAAEPERIFARLAEIALDLCDAGSAGISILETAPSGETVFRWRALAGRLKPLQGGTAPRDFSLCGVCLDERRPVLLSRPGRLLTYLNDAGVEIVEGLVVPLQIGRAHV